jgi:hypothetical protein
MHYRPSTYSYLFIFPVCFTGYHRVSSGITGYHRVSPGITGYHRVSLDPVFFDLAGLRRTSDAAGGAGHA